MIHTKTLSGGVLSSRPIYADGGTPLDIAQIFSQMLILFLLMALGFTAVKTGILTGESNRHLTNLVLYITNPCTILYSVLSGKAMLTIREVLELTVIALLFYLALIGLSYLVPKLLRVPADQAGTYRFMTVFGNIGFMGFPVVRSIFGQGAVFYAAIFNLFFQLFAYTWGVRQVARDARDTKVSVRTFLQPVIIAALASYIIYLCGAQERIAGSAVGGLLTRLLGMVDGITSPLCMIITGVGLAQIPLGKVFGNGRLYLLSIGKQLLLPVLAYFALSPFVSNRLMLGICIIMAAMPIGTMASLFCARYDGPVDLAASGIFLSTLLSIPAVPLLMSLFF